MDCGKNSALYHSLSKCCVVAQNFINIQPGQGFMLITTQFNVTMNTSECCKYVMSFYRMIINRFCGDNTPSASLKSQSNLALVLLRAPYDADDQQQAVGFQLQYRAV